MGPDKSALERVPGYWPESGDKIILRNSADLLDLLAGAS